MSEQRRGDNNRRMPKEDVIQMQGEIVENLPDATFKVKLENGHVVVGHVSGRCGCTTSASFPATR